MARFRACAWGLLPVFIAGALTCSAATFYVTVAGLGGEPDYEQRFTSQAQEILQSVMSQVPRVLAMGQRRAWLWWLCLWFCWALFLLLRSSK